MYKLIGIFIVFFGSSISFAAESKVHPLDNMPLVQSQFRFNNGALPEENRTKDVIRFLNVGVKISYKTNNKIISGSGTIVYYDKKTRLAYIASCGHLWHGNMTSEQGKKKNLSANITIWYQNYIKLPVPKIYVAKVLFYSNGDGVDSSLLCFQPDWIPEYFPIAPANYPLYTWSTQHSIGCDNGTEVADYEVQIYGMIGNNLITVKNSPRPGRSGGGLLNIDGYYIGTCWGTDSFTGSGHGYFTPLHGIHAVWIKNEFDFLLNIKPLNPIGNIPILDRNRPQGKYEENYIPFPTN